MGLYRPRSITSAPPAKSCRVEPDGSTITQITNELDPISDFDVSQINGEIAYISGNQLILTGPTGGKRIVKVTGAPVNPKDSKSRITQQITNPRFSPDGTQIAFGLNGVNQIAAGSSTKSNVLLPSDPYPDPQKPPTGIIRFFQPDSWSPDGKYLLVSFSYWPEAGGIAILDVNKKSLTGITSSNSKVVVCCDAAWSQDSNSLYIASNLLAYGVPGLAQVDAATGAATTVIQGTPDGQPNPANPYQFFRAPHPVSPDALFIFLSRTGDLNQSPTYTMQHILLENGKLTPLRNDGRDLKGDILWAQDSSGAVVVDKLVADQAPFDGHLFWLPANGSPASELQAVGHTPLWGLPLGTSIPATPTASPPKSSATPVVSATAPAAVITTTTTPAATLTPSSAPSSTCTNRAAFVADVSVPDGTVLAPGQVVDKVWRVSNTGTCTWSKAYHWRFGQGDQLSDLTSIPLAQPVAPGSDALVTVTLTAPINAGHYRGQWQLADPGGKTFPEALYYDVQVASTPTILYFRTNRSIVRPGEQVILSWDVINSFSGVFLRTAGSEEGVVAPGTKVVYPIDTTTYEIVARNNVGESVAKITVQVSKTVTVTPPPANVLPQIDYFKADRNNVKPGDRVILSWDAHNAFGGVFLRQGGNEDGVVAPGTQVIYPTSTITYTLVARNDNGEKAASLTVDVQQPK